MALSRVLPRKQDSLAQRSAGSSREAARIPTLDELATGWLDCSLLAHMPSLHNFHEMAACAPDLVGVNFFPGGQLYEDSGPRWYIYNALPLCRLLIDGGQYDSSSFAAGLLTRRSGEPKRAIWRCSLPTGW